MKNDANAESEVRSNAQLADSKQLEIERGFREREVVVKENEQRMHEAELDLRKKEHSASRWANPLVVGVWVAAVAAGGNVYVAYENGATQRQLESDKAEQARILKVIETGNPQKAAENLQFLLDTGLISDPATRTRLITYLKQPRPAGSGPALPAPPGASLRQRVQGSVETSHAGDAPGDGPDVTSCVKADVEHGWNILRGSGRIVADTTVNGALGITKQDETDDRYCGTFHVVRTDPGRSAGVQGHAEAVETSNGESRYLR
ncbi:hypothetical protein P3T24_006317 [Paraburkholderia sp. GAS33]|uniref:hypothetical protein n=1 Tax=Paraburkholderia sp. GAS33 TaxID=3035130 RepID=UPI003D25BD3E